MTDPSILAPDTADKERHMGLTVQVHDVAHGCAAGRVDVRLERRSGCTWTRVACATTDDTGRIGADALGPPGEGGTFRLVVEAEKFFASFGLAAAQVEVSTVLRMTDPHDHVRISVLLAPVACTLLTEASWS